MGEPGGEPLGTVAVSPEDVGDEPDLLARLPKKPLQVLRQLGLFGDGEPAYGHARALARDVLDVGHVVLLAAYGPHLLFSVALAGGRPARHDLLDAGEVVFGEPYTGGTGVLFEVLAALGTRDGDDVVTLGEQPCEGELPRGDALAVGDLAHPVRQLQVFREVLLRKAGESGAAGVVLGHVLDAPPTSGEEASSERAVGDETNAELSDGRQDFILHIAGKERIFRLERAYGMDRVGPSDSLGRGLGNAEIAHFSGVHELFHRAPGLFDGRLGVHTVLVVEVYVVDPQALQRSVASFSHIVGVAAYA